MPIEVPAGGAAFHDGWTWHGSPPNERADAERRSIISHMVTSDTVWSERETHPLYSRYRRPGERELDEAFFPVVWRSEGEPTRADRRGLRGLTAARARQARYESRRGRAR